VRADNGTLNISGDVLISGNTASSGGAIISYGSRTTPVINISGGTITGNKATSGGCLQLNGSKLTITGGAITDNTSNSATLMLQATQPSNRQSKSGKDRRKEESEKHG